MGNRASRCLGGRTGQRLVLSLVLLGVAVAAYGWGRIDSAPQVIAAPPEPRPSATEAPTAPDPSSDYSRRVVAYIYSNIPITREDLGEYLIARYGADKLELLVNKKIIDHECQQRGIEVTAAEINAALEEDMAGIHVNRKEFVDSVLKKYGKTLYEWKEDVIRPRLLLGKLCMDQVHVDDADLQKAFTAYYGEKIDCRIIMWPKNEHTIALNEYEKIRDNEESFNHKSTHQASGQLSARGGQIDPFGRYTTGDEELEKEAFRLQPGEISRLIGTPQGDLVIKCVKRIPANDQVKLKDVQAKLEKEIINKKIQMMIPEVFKGMQKKAEPKIFMKAADTEEDLKKTTSELMNSTAPKGGAPVHPPHAD